MNTPVTVPEKNYKIVKFERNFLLIVIFTTILPFILFCYSSAQFFKQCSLSQADYIEYPIPLLPLADLRMACPTPKWSPKTTPPVLNSPPNAKSSYVL